MRKIRMTKKGRACNLKIAKNVDLSYKRIPGYDRFPKGKDVINSKKK